MELEFKENFSENRDVDINNLDTIVGHKIDYFNSIDIDVNWVAVIYSKSYGITDIFPAIRDIVIRLDYMIEEPEEGFKEGDKEEGEFELVIPYLQQDLDPERNRSELSYEDRKWIVNTSYNKRDEDDTHLFPTYFEIDFEEKTIDIEF